MNWEQYVDSIQDRYDRWQAQGRIRNTSKVIPVGQALAARFDSDFAQSLRLVFRYAWLHEVIPYLAGLDLPTHGHVVLNGSNLLSLDEDGRARVRAESVGFVFQSFHLVPSLNALENVMLPLELAGRDDAREASRAIIERGWELLELRTMSMSLEEIFLSLTQDSVALGEMTRDATVEEATADTAEEGKDA